MSIEGFEVRAGRGNRKKGKLWTMEEVKTYSNVGVWSSGIHNSTVKQ